MNWLIDEVFALAIALADELGPFRGDTEYALLPDRPTCFGPTDPLAQYRGSTTVEVGIGAVFLALRPIYNRFLAGLKRAEEESQTFPPTVADEVRRLQCIVNGVHGKIGFADVGKHFANSDLGAVGKRGWEAVLRHIKPLPFPSAERRLMESDPADLTAVVSHFVSSLPLLLKEARTALSAGKRLLVIWKRTGSQRMDERAGMSNYLSWTRYRLAPDSDDDPDGGHIPVFDRPEFRDWLAANPDLQEILADLWDSTVGTKTETRATLQLFVEDFSPKVERLADWIDKNGRSVRWYGERYTFPVTVMPSLTKDNELLVSVIERWRDGAIEEIDDIGSWRTATDDPPDPMPGIVYDRLISGNGWCPPKNFYGDTSFLVRRITTGYQHLDPSPLQDIYEAVARWHMDHNARLIPDQATLSLKLDRSVQTLQVVNGSIMDASRKMKNEYQEDTADTTARSRSGRPKDEQIAKRNLRIKQLCKQHKLHSKWAKLAEVANADEEIQALNLDISVTRDIARNAVQPPNKRRK